MAPDAEKEFVPGIEPEGVSVHRYTNSAMAIARRRRILLASWFEQVATSVILLVAIVQNYNYYGELTPNPSQRLVLTLTNLWVVSFASLLFLQLVVTVLTGASLLVGRYIALFGTRHLFEEVFFEGTVSVSGKDLDRPEPPLTAQDELRRQFANTLNRSAETLRLAERRPNTLLLVGTTIAGAGLAFFILTLPGFVGTTNDGDIIGLSDVYRKMIDLLPRLLMLIFIQLLAGFFLRQYRTSMEELRYYESLLRTRESQLLGYQLLSSSEGDRLHEFARSLVDSRDKDFLRMQQGETTVILETQRSEANEFKTVPEMIFDFFKSQKPDSGAKIKEG